MNPCPFCGSSRLIVTMTHHAAVCCLSCRATGPIIPVPHYITKKNWWLRLRFKAIRAWNAACCRGARHDRPGVPA